MKICFFVKTNDTEIFNKVEFYRNDLDILANLGHTVDCCNQITSLLYKRYDLYFVWWFGYGVFPTFLSFLLGKKSIVIGNIHGLSGEGLSNWPFRKRILMKLCMKLASKSLFTSYTEFNRLESFKPKNFSILYNCVQHNKYFEDKKIERKKIILTISNLTKENVKRKMLLESLYAFSIFLKNNKDFIYIICGKEGDGLPSIINQIEFLNISHNVIIKGSVSVEKKINLLRTSLLYLQPTLSEGFGVAILEAQACGVPVITTFEPCINEVFSDSVVRASNIENLSLNMGLLANNDFLYDKYVKLGIKNSYKYSFQRRQKEIKSIIETLYIS
jgi:glycosyltransferase involved in cell wall biosynthesis